MGNIHLNYSIKPNEMSQGAMTPAVSRASPAFSRIPSTIPGFDDLCGGGLLPGRTYIVSGVPGSGKTTLALQWLYGGAREHGQPGIYIAAEQGPRQLREEARAFGWELEPLEAGRKLVLLDASSARAEVPSTEKAVLSSPRNLEETLDALITLQEEFNTGRAVVDSITALTYHLRDPVEQRDAIHKLNQTLKILEMTALMLSEQTHNPNSSFGPEHFIADGHIALYYRRVQDMRIHSIEAFKMRGTEHSHKIHPFDITPRGIVVKKEESVFGEF